MSSHIRKMLAVFVLTAVGIGAAQVAEAQPRVRPPVYIRDYGFKITYVFPGTTAYHHGLEPGDTIVAVNGHRLRSSGDLHYHLSRSGHSALLQVIDVRSGFTRHIRVHPQFGRIGVDGFLVELSGYDPYPPYPPHPWPPFRGTTPRPGL